MPDVEHSAVHAVREWRPSRFTSCQRFVFSVHPNPGRPCARGDSHKKANAEPFSRFEMDGEYLSGFCSVFFCWFIRRVSYLFSFACTFAIHLLATRPRTPGNLFILTRRSIYILFVSVSLNRPLAKDKNAASAELAHGDGSEERRIAFAESKMNGKLFSENVSNNYCRLFRTNSGIYVVAKSTL